MWYLPDGELVLKATWPDFFGLLVVHRPHEEQKASPIAYLERWHLHNEVFGDQVVFLGALESDLGLFHSDTSFARRSQTAATKHLNLQNQELTTHRDWLLPMLMNGQVRVTE